MEGATHWQYQGTFCTSCFHALAGDIYTGYGAADDQLAGTIIISGNYYFAGITHYCCTYLFHFIIGQGQYGCHG